MAESNGLLNRRTGSNPYRGFESPPLRSMDRFNLDQLGPKTRTTLARKIAVNLVMKSRHLWSEEIALAIARLAESSLEIRKEIGE